MANRGDLTDDHWARLSPLQTPAGAPPQKPAVGRPAEDHRRILNGILWRARTGAPWRDAPERYGPWSTLGSRLRRWRLAGIWDQIFAAVQAQADAEGRLDWEVQFVDGSTIRAHQHAAGGKGGPKSKRSAAAEAATRRKSTCERRGRASRSLSS